MLALTLVACADPQIAPDIPVLPITDFTVETIADGLKAPWSVAAVGNGAYFVTEKTGGLKFIDQNGDVSDVAGLPEDIHVDQQGGLLEIALPSTFVRDDTVYLSYASGNKNANATKLLKARFVGSELVDQQVIFTASPTKDTGSHFGGRIVFLDDNTLILTLGDGFTYREEAQNKNSHLGKIVRLNTDGSIPADNPFADVEGAKPEIYSWGHRNVQGLHFDSETGLLWAHEHGPKGGDELNLIKAGANYGWPLATTGVDYNGAKITPFETFENTEPFVHDWVPSIAPSGMTIYRGNMFPDWNGDALIGGLMSRDVRRIDLENSKSVGEEALFTGLDARIRDVRAAPDGSILLVTDDPENGKLLRITPRN
ncbi:MAG: PQQ-dependent sugar dehydrogenase [Hyphomonadaceae bacterium]|nr:PQQ-dependent sugar dehydrogenase [Hyphomonadaceae bacterium]